MIREVGEDIGNAIGWFIEADVPENGLGWGRYLCIRVDVDVSLPLLRGKILERADGSLFKVDFQYEHLPTFCYRCGCLGHGGNECIVGRGSRNVMSGGVSDLYGSWLRAPPRQSSRSHFAQPTNAHLRSSSATPSGGSSRSNTGGPTGVSSVRAPEEVVANPVYQKPVIPISTPVSHAGNGSRSSGLAATGFIPIGIQVDATVVGESQLFQEKTRGSGESHARGESYSNLKRVPVSESVEYGLHVTAELPNPSPQSGIPSGVVKGKSTSPNLHMHMEDLVPLCHLEDLVLVKDRCSMGRRSFGMWIQVHVFLRNKIRGLWLTPNRWRLLSSPAGHYEVFQFELSWAWEPRDSS